jgi:metallo-beta-lactamase family protein
LLAWLGHFRDKPRRVFVTHGEDGVATGFAETLATRFGWNAMAPEAGHSVILD